jgi:HK97 family phage prohead protease
MTGSGGLLWAGADGGLELRAAGDGSHQLQGSFPYGTPAVLSDGGRAGAPRKEIIAPGAFAWRVEDPGEDIHLLVGHSYDRPLASKATGTLKLRDTSKALLFQAMITPEIAATSWGADFLAGLAAGLITGISPGFRLPPERRVAEAEKVEEEDYDPARGMFGALIRTVLSALLFELSAVTRPAYPEAQIEARNWTATPTSPLLRPASYRWRR